MATEKTNKKQKTSNSKKKIRSNPIFNELHSFTEDDAPKDPAEMGADGPYPYSELMKRNTYEKTLKKLQLELLKLQGWVKENNKKIVILFEGRDAAGKGGTIKRFTEHLNPRGARVIALQKPNETEKGQWYFQRYISQLPTSGEILFFDRSWYNRAGVEPVMGFCTPRDYLRFMRQVPNVERGLIDSGMHLIKLWFDVSQEIQKERIESRQKDPFKHWKLTPMDFESMSRWDEYTRARDSMFFYTNTRESPWHVIRSDCKKRARIAAIQTVLSHFDYPEKEKELVGDIDSKIAGLSSDMFPTEGRMIFDIVRT
jgi:polyphosphate kinase 2